MNKLRNLGLGFLLVFATIFAAEAHPYHTSIAEIRYNAKLQTLEIAVKVFADDLEKTLSNAAKKPVIVAQTPVVQAQIAAYLKKVLALEISGKESLPLKYVGSEAEKDTYWLYAEVPVKPAQLKQIQLRHQLFLDTFEDQMNIVNLEINDQKRTLLFKKDDYRKPLM
jgi:hypothetical protein